MTAMRRLALLPALALCALALASAAQARVMLVASGQGTATLLDVSSGALVARVPLPGAARDVAIAPDGVRGYVAAGATVAAIDLNARAGLTAVTLRGTPVAMAMSASGKRIAALRKGAIDVIDPATLTIVRSVALGAHARKPTAIAVSADGVKAVVALDAQRIAVVDLVGGSVKRFKLANVTGVAFAPTGRHAYAATSSRKSAALVTVDTSAGKLGRAIRTRPGPGGSVAVTANGKNVIVGAGPGARVTVVYDLARGRVTTRLAAGTGPGHPAVAPDGVRLYVADERAGTISVLSALSFRRLSVRRLAGGERPRALAVQPGVGLISGTDGPDRLTGTRLADRVLGLGGDDLLYGGRGADVVDGGDGDDTVDGGADGDTLAGGTGADHLYGQQGDDVLDAGPDNDYANGGTGNDTIDGGDGDDSLDGGEGDDIIHGSAGNDRIIETSLGNDVLLDGGDGNDYIDGGRGTDVIEGDAGDDTLLGGPGGEKIDAGDGNDTIDGGTGGDAIYGRDGNDAIRGDAGRDTLYGAAGNDQLDGGSGDDTLSGGDGADEIVAGPGADVVTGGRGPDDIRVADGDHDIVDCGTGHDTVYVEQDAPTRDTLRSCETVIPVPAEPATDAPPPSHNIFGTVYDDLLVGTDADDSLFGNDGHDVIYGGAGNDYVDGENDDDELHGGLGDDSLHGRGGNDVILGNEGDDSITGDRGNDTINGGPGNDTIFGNLDDDVIAGDEGDDRIQVVGGGHDRVSCGDGKDVVFADATDEVAPDCEDVRR
jgi:Ca2+-binding RTX toxin-like protein